MSFKDSRLIEMSYPFIQGIKLFKSFIPTRILTCIVTTRTVYRLQRNTDLMQNEAKVADSDRKHLGSTTARRYNKPSFGENSSLTAGASSLGFSSGLAIIRHLGEKE